MKQIVRYRKSWLTASVGAVALASVATVGLSASANASTKSRVHRPEAVQAGTQSALNASSALATGAASAFNQEFTINTNLFCQDSPPNAPCDGNDITAADYGTIDRVASGFSNGGFNNYAPSTAALFKGYMAVVSGDEDQNQGMACPRADVVEYCSGPYALFPVVNGNAGSASVFPSNGFTVTNDLYLQATGGATQPVPNGQLVDDDIGLNNSAGHYGIDNVITACYENSGYVINFGNNSPGSCAGTPVVTTNGWYRFVFDFSNVAGDAYLTESVYQEGTSGPTLVATSGHQPVGGTGTSIHNWGGPGYFWLPTEDISGLPLANFALQNGQHPMGYTP
jgi:hypothetical protein